MSSFSPNVDCVSGLSIFDCSFSLIKTQNPDKLFDTCIYNEILYMGVQVIFSFRNLQNIKVDTNTREIRSKKSPCEG
jgi:hypothetical protein